MGIGEDNESMSVCVPVRRYGKAGSPNQTVVETDDKVVTESSFTVVLNGERIYTGVCSPSDLDCLAVGYLLTGGWLKKEQDILSVKEKENVVEVVTKTGVCPVESRPLLLALEAGFICDIIDELLNRSKLFRETGGLHAAALCDREKMLFWHEDIGRHNAVDKVLGECVLRNIDTEDKMLVLTGRMSSEIVYKAAQAGVPVVATKAPPTNLGVSMAEERGITLIGFVRDRRLTVYSNMDRVLIRHGNGRPSALKKNGDGARDGKHV